MRSKRKIAVFLIILALLFVVIRLQRQPGGEHDAGLAPEAGPSAAAPADPAPSDPPAPAVVDASVPRPEVGPADLSAIARRAAEERFGGEITFTFEPGATVFKLVLPLASKGDQPSG